MEFLLDIDGIVDGPAEDILIKFAKGLPALPDVNIGDIDVSEFSAGDRTLSIAENDFSSWTDTDFSSQADLSSGNTIENDYSSTWDADFSSENNSQFSSDYATEFSSGSNLLSNLFNESSSQLLTLHLDGFSLAG